MTATTIDGITTRIPAAADMDQVIDQWTAAASAAGIDTNWVDFDTTLGLNDTPGGRPDTWALTVSHYNDPTAVERGVIDAVRDGDEYVLTTRGGGYRYQLRQLATDDDGEITAHGPALRAASLLEIAAAESTADGTLWLRPKIGSVHTERNPYAEDMICAQVVDTTHRDIVTAPTALYPTDEYANLTREQARAEATVKRLADARAIALARAHADGMSYAEIAVAIGDTLSRARVQQLVERGRHLIKPEGS